MISGGAALAGVIGWPVAHSLSPKLHNHWLKELGIDGAYMPLAVRPEHLGQAVKALPLLGFKGFNITVPHKQAVMEHLDSIDDAARKIGAVNTVTISTSGTLHGTNTDAYGFMENLKNALSDTVPHLKHPVILGAGGAARAVIHGLIGAGAEEITLLNRTPARAASLAEHFAPFPIHVHPLDDNKALSRATLVVNTTSIGLDGAGAPIHDFSSVERQAPVADIVYGETAFLTLAKAAGHPTVSGIGMLIHQAVPGFEAWFGRRPEVTPALARMLLS